MKIFILRYHRIFMIPNKILVILIQDELSDIHDMAK